MLILIMTSVAFVFGGVLIMADKSMTANKKKKPSN
jgi:hypothetical protein